MAQHGHDNGAKEKVVYVGDSRVRQNKKEYIPQDYSAYPGKSEVFIPNFLLKEWMVAAVLMVGILVLVMSDPAPLGYPADPTNTSFIPMPDWYFLFLYQLLKYPYTSQDYIVFGTFIFPTIAFGSLMLAPFLDTSKERRFYRRPIPSSLMILSLMATGWLTWVSWNHYQEELTKYHITPESVRREAQIEAHKIQAGVSQETQTKKQLPAIVAASDPAYGLYKKATCIACHGANMQGNANAGIPMLLGVGDKFNKDQILGIIKNGRGKGKMPPQYDANIKSGLTAAQIDQIAAWLAKQKTSSKSG